MSEQLQQGSAEWFEARKGLVTGSRAGAILGLNPWQTANDVMRIMVREYFDAEPEFKGNIATRWGNDNEATALQAFVDGGFVTVEETGFHAHPDLDFLGASPDGLVGDNAVLEIKCPYSLRYGGEYKTSADQLHYYTQMQIEMACTGRERCYFVQWSPVLPLYVEVVEFNQAWLEESLPELEAFHKEYLRVIGDFELSAIHLEELEYERGDLEWEEAAHAWKEAKAAKAKAEKAMKDAEKTLKELGGEHKCRGGGVLLYSRQAAPRVSYSKVVADLLPDADLSAYTSEAGATTWHIKESK